MQEVFEKIIEKLGRKRAYYNAKFESTQNLHEKDEATTRFEDFNEAIEIVKQAAEEFATDTNVGSNGWISCSERLPETNESVLCWAKSTARGGDVCFVGSCHNGFWFLQSSADTHSFPGQYVIVAWQPLPEPYQTNICDASDCPFNDGRECPAAEGCAGYEPKGE